VAHSAERISNPNNAKFETELEENLVIAAGAQMGSTDEKARGGEYHAAVPLIIYFLCLTPSWKWHFSHLVRVGYTEHSPSKFCIRY
jgi:hypothetical protein